MLLSLRVDPDATCADVRALAQAKIAGVDEKIRILRRIRKGLVEITAACRGRGPTEECPILGAFERAAETLS